MVATGLGFAAFTAFWPLLVIAVVGTLNPSAGDVSVFLPTEQAVLAGDVADAATPVVFAIYNLGGDLRRRASARWRRACRERLADALGWDVARRAAGRVPRSTPLAASDLRRLPAAAAASRDAPPPRRSGAGVRSHASRRTCSSSPALFSLDSAGSGFVVTSLLVLWLHLRFDLSAGATAARLLRGRPARRLLAAPGARAWRRGSGSIRTMAFTHLPANVLAGARRRSRPTGAVAIALLLVRALFSQMDVPARQAFVMAVVPPEERAAAASVTNVPRSLASAATPLLAGVLLAATDLRLAADHRRDDEAHLRPRCSSVLYRDVPGGRRVPRPPRPRPTAELEPHPFGGSPPRSVAYTLGSPLRGTTSARSSMDRASDYGSEGWGFDSLRARSFSAVRPAWLRRPRDPRARAPSVSATRRRGLARRRPCTKA